MPSVFGVPRTMKSAGQDHQTTDRPRAHGRDGGTRPGLIARGLAALSRLLALLVLAGLLLKGIGEFVSDRYAWSQWLEWSPNLLVAAGSLAVLVLATLIARLASRAARPWLLGRSARWVLRAAWAAFLVHAVYTIVVDVPFYRPRPAGPGSLDNSMRILFWNAAVHERDGWEDAVINDAPDVVVLVGLSSRGPLPKILESMPDDATRLVYDRFTVLSALPLVRFGFTHLNIEAGEGYDPRLPEGRRAQYDPGAAMYVEIGGRRDEDPPTTLWIVDLPSDISLSRSRVTREARAAIDAFDGMRMIRTANDSWTIEPGTGYAGPKGFPTPDLIIGDFNIPRGAASLSRLNMGFPDAFDQAATGYRASWPRRLPLWHLDQAFIGPRFRAWRYQVRDAGSGAHLMQVVDVTPQ